MAKLNDDGSLDFGQDDWQFDEQPKPVKKTTQPDPNDPAEIARLNSIYGPNGTALKKPTPTSTWDAQNEQWNPDTTQPNPDADVRSFIASLASMPGADPSLAADPDYWVKAITSRGGLTPDNRDYWTKAGVGPTAFFNNPNRESGGGGNAGGGGAASSGGSGSQLSDFLMQLLMAGRGNNTDPARAALMQRLNGLMDDYSKPVSASDANIAGPTQAYTGQVGRSVNQFRKTAAERAYAEGVPTGSFDSQIGNAELSGGRSVGDFETNLMAQELQSRRANLMATLNSAQGLLSAQDQADIQNKIANIDAVIKSKGLDLTNKGLDINADLGSQSLALQKLLGMTGLGHQAMSIANQNNQFYDKLGADEANQGSMLDQILQSLLIGRA